jgi:hypothetical protein
MAPSILPGGACFSLPGAAVLGNRRPLAWKLDGADAPVLLLGTEGENQGERTFLRSEDRTPAPSCAKEETMADRTTKVLLGLITVALVGLLVRSFYAATPILAADGPEAAVPVNSVWVKLPNETDGTSASSRQVGNWISLPDGTRVAFHADGEHQRETATIYPPDSGLSDWWTVDDPATVDALRSFVEGQSITRRKP